MLIQKPDPGDHPQISSLNDLLYLPDVAVGTLNGGMIKYAFRHSDTMPYTKLWRKIINSKPSTLTDTNAQGVQRVRTSKGKYIFIIQSDLGDYNAQEEPCDLMTVDQFFPRQLSFSVQKHSTELLEKINKAIYRLEQSELQRLYNKWWFEKTPCTTAPYTGHARHLHSSSHKFQNSPLALLVFITCTFVSFIEKIRSI